MITIALSGSIHLLQPYASKPYDPNKDNGPGRLQRVGDGRLCIRGESIRGRWRRLATRLLSDRTGQQLTVESFAFNVVGGLMDGSSTIDFAAVARRRMQNPIIGLLGASTPFMTAGRINVGLAIAPMGVQPQVFTTVRGDDLRQGNNHDLLAEGEIERFTRMAAANTQRSAAQAQMKELETERRKAIRTKQNITDLDAEIARLKAVVETVSSDALGSHSLQQVQPGYETIPAGTVLDHRIFLHAPTPVEVGLFAAILQAWAPAPFLGAQSARGCGLVAAHYTVRGVRRLGDAYEPLGTITIDPDADEPCLFEDPTDIWLNSRAALDDAIAMGAIRLEAPPSTRSRSDGPSDDSSANEGDDSHG